MENKGDSSPNNKSLPSSFDENPNPSKIQENTNEVPPSESESESDQSQDQTMSADASATQVEGGSEGQEGGESSDEKITTKPTKVVPNDEDAVAKSSAAEGENPNNNVWVSKKRKSSFNYNKFNDFYVDVRGLPSIQKSPKLPREGGKRSAEVEVKENSIVQEGLQAQGGERRKKRKMDAESSSATTQAVVPDLSCNNDEEVMENSENDSEATKEEPAIIVAPPTAEKKMEVEAEEGEANKLPLLADEEKVEAEDIQMENAHEDAFDDSEQNTATETAANPSATDTETNEVVQHAEEDEVDDAIIVAEETTVVKEQHDTSELEEEKKETVKKAEDDEEKEEHDKEQQSSAENEDGAAEADKSAHVGSPVRNNVKNDFDLNELPPEAAEGNY